jgi:hypothetical protein
MHPDFPKQDPGAGHVGERKVGRRELEEGLDGAVGNGGGEQRPQVSGPREVVVGSGTLS